MTIDERASDDADQSAGQASAFGAESSSAVGASVAPLASPPSCGLASSDVAPLPFGAEAGSDFDGGAAELGTGVPSFKPS